MPCVRTRAATRHDPANRLNVDGDCDARLVADKAADERAVGEHKPDGPDPFGIESGAQHRVARGANRVEVDIRVAAGRHNFLWRVHRDDRRDHTRSSGRSGRSRRSRRAGVPTAPALALCCTFPPGAATATPLIAAVSATSATTMDGDTPKILRRECFCRLGIMPSFRGPEVKTGSPFVTAFLPLWTKRPVRSAKGRSCPAMPPREVRAMRPITALRLMYSSFQRVTDYLLTNPCLSCGFERQLAVEVGE